ncbi:MAG TPA: GNAT family N-acetyltransferase [Ignavibacteria bacterium]|nr:GNAT family N-acetyltransferase [Ignavibacteria bacterium]HMR41641.1 GNAT family N-acetyltransferase [Ignavibacteria bacterium]
MIKIKNLSEITHNELLSFGIIQFTSNSKYKVIREESEDEIEFNLKLTRHPEFLVGAGYNDKNELEKYNRIMKEGNSFGAYEDDKLIGFVIAEKREWNNSLRVEMIRVAKDHKRKGIGTLLLNELEKHTRSVNVRLIDIETQNTNVPAIDFYRKNGYEFAGLNMTLYDPEEVGEDIAVFLSKSIKY